MRLTARPALAGAALLLLLGLPAWAQSMAARSVVVIHESQLAGPGLSSPQTVPALTILACQSCPSSAGEELTVLTPEGRQATLPRQAGLLLAEEPEQARIRLRRLLAVELDQPSILRLLAGRIAQGDSTWLVETAWGPPQRRFMVNYFMDEEHFVYLRPGGEPLLLRFKGGRLLAPLPAQSLSPAVERPSPPR